MVTKSLPLLQMKRMKVFGILLFVFSFMACKQERSVPDAQAIVDRAIDEACSGHCDHVTIDFTFRDRCYVSKRDGGKFQLERITSDSLGVTHDILTNENFRRYQNDTLIKLPDSTSIKYANSVNSVHYFLQLPFGLNDKAVQKELLGEDEVKGQPYFEIAVSFLEEGGGTDFQDRFVYWVHQETYTVDYLAYSYETDGGGIRFREAFNPRVINGIRFVDYRNFKPAGLDVKLADLDTLFEKEELKLLSKIENESIGVRLGAN